MTNVTHMGTIGGPKLNNIIQDVSMVSKCNGPLPDTLTQKRLIFRPILVEGPLQTMDHVLKSSRHLQHSKHVLVRLTKTLKEHLFIERLTHHKASTIRPINIPIREYFGFRHLLIQRLAADTDLLEICPVPTEDIATVLTAHLLELNSVLLEGLVVNDHQTQDTRRQALAEEGLKNTNREHQPWVRK